MTTTTTKPDVYKIALEALLLHLAGPRLTPPSAPSCPREGPPDLGGGRWAWL